MWCLVRCQDHERGSLQFNLFQILIHTFNHLLDFLDCLYSVLQRHLEVKENVANGFKFQRLCSVNTFDTISHNLLYCIYHLLAVDVVASLILYV